MIVHQREKSFAQPSCFKKLQPLPKRKKKRWESDTASTAFAENCTAQHGLAHASLSVQELENGKTGSKKGSSSSGRHPKWKN
jgi:hypothetical protein